MTILLDTQTWVWWSTQSERLSRHHQLAIEAVEAQGIAVSAFSVWEVAMLVVKGRLDLKMPVQTWMDEMLSIPTLHVLPATPQILLNSTLLPGQFHPDPADRIIVATARTFNLQLLTTDQLILDYEHVRTIGPDEPRSAV